MDIQQVKTDYRMSQWVQIIQDQKNSGQNIKDFCQVKGISNSAYFYWQRKIRQMACKEMRNVGGFSNLAPQGWVQCSAGPSVKTDLCIEVSGCNIKVDADTDLDLLREVCNVLRSL